MAKASASCLVGIKFLTPVMRKLPRPSGCPSSAVLLTWDARTHHASTSVPVSHAVPVNVVARHLLAVCWMKDSRCTQKSKQAPPPPFARFHWVRAQVPPPSPPPQKKNKNKNTRTVCNSKGGCFAEGLGRDVGRCWVLHNNAAGSTQICMHKRVVCGTKQ